MMNKQHCNVHGNSSVLQRHLHLVTISSNCRLLSDNDFCIVITTLLSFGIQSNFNSSNIFGTMKMNSTHGQFQPLGPVVQSVVRLTSSLRVISLTVLADTIHNILIFFSAKKFSIFAYHLT